YVGPADRAEATIAPLRKSGTIVADQLRPISYVELQSLFDAARPAGRRCAMRSNFMAALPDAAIEILVEGFRTTPSPLSAVILEPCHGAIARVAPDATAFGLRSNPFHLEILAFWDQAEEDAANLAWVERLFADVRPFNTGEVYVNSLDEGEGHRVREALWDQLHQTGSAQSQIRPYQFFPLQSQYPTIKQGGGMAANPLLGLSVPSQLLARADEVIESTRRMRLTERRQLLPLSRDESAEPSPLSAVHCFDLSRSTLHFSVRSDLPRRFCQPFLQDAGSGSRRLGSCWVRQLHCDL